MELKSYLKIIKAEKKMIIAFSLITGLAAWAFSTYMPAKYNASISLFVNKQGSQETNDFKYDGYYALESGEIIADNIEKMLQSPEIVNEIYSKSQIDPNFKNIKSYKKKFSAHKMSNLYVEVSFETNKREDAEKISEALIKTVKEKIGNTEIESAKEISFSVSNNQPIIIESRPDAIINGTIGIFSGLFLGILAAFLKKYFS